MVSGSQAHEKVWLFFSPITFNVNVVEKYVSGISETFGMKYISTIPSHVCCAFIYNLTLCKNHLNNYFAYF